MLISPAVIHSEFIYTIPPTPSCHASTITEIAPGVLAAAWFGGTAESDPDVGIWLSRSVNGKWTAPIEVVNGNPDGKRKYSCYNPVLFQPKNGPLLLFYKVGTGPSTWWGMLIRSTDGGKTWDSPTRLPEGILGPIKNRPIELLDGTLVCPSSSEDHGWRVHFEFTPDLGKTWHSTPPLNDGKVIGAIQPSILRREGSHFWAIGRTQQGRLFSIDSLDLGKTWSEMRLLDVLNPNSGTDAITLKDGRFLLVFNNSKTARTPLNVALSKDAEHWTSVLTLEDQPGEYSYPTVIQSSDGLVHITYTWHRTRVKHVVVDPKTLGLP